MKSVARGCAYFSADPVCKLYNEAKKRRGGGRWREVSVLKTQWSQRPQVLKYWRAIMRQCAQVSLSRGLIVAALALLVGAPGHAAEWPARPVHIVAPFGPAGAADKFARVLADYLPAELKQPVVVENRGGGGGIVGSAQVARAEPDGYTLLISSLASQAIAPALSPNPGFDSLRDFTHIAYFGGPPIGWVVTQGSDLRR